MWRTRDDQVTFKLEKVIDILMLEARKKWQDLPKAKGVKKLVPAIKIDPDTDEQMLVINIETWEKE